LAEMLSRTYHESQDKPTYVIREVLEPNPLTDRSGTERRDEVVRT
jgi:hypothetical protein